MNPKDAPNSLPSLVAGEEESAPPTRPDELNTTPPATAPPAPHESCLFGLSIPGHEILSELGRGGMGVVYKARDCKRDQLVALKTLQHADAAALYRFKQEFRVLADVAHSNLVTRYDLGSDGATCYFTMELLDGVDLLTHVRGGRSGQSGLTPPQLSRLRESLRRLAEGISALHAAGILHRDVKPRNVMVTTQGRTVLLDFGLAAVLDREGTHQSTEQQFVGTVAYAAPEQAASLPVSFPADWYALGTLLYELLTGQLPFRGNCFEVLRAKNEQDPPPPRETWPAVPDDLNQLCVELLRRDPNARPCGEEVLRRLSGTAVASLRRQTALVGRERHLASLTDAFESMKRGGTVTVRVHGPSGSGKSALLRCYLDGLSERGEAVILAGRCYEQESMPYKALDSLVDALSRHLGRLSALEVQALLPRDVLPLVRVFPVLARFDTGRTPRTLDGHDPREVRRRAFASLRELLGRLGDRQPLVLAIDDLQWGDADSAVLLSDLLLPPDPPALLLIGCHRSEDAQCSPFLRSFARLHAQGAETIDRRELAIEPLSPQEAEELAGRLIGENAGLHRHAARLGREARGNPFFVQELVAYLSDVDVPPTVWLTLDEMVWRRVLGLPDEVRRFLEVVAIAGRPLAQADACEAAGLARGDRDAPSLLRTARLIRGTGAPEKDAVECYHDRIRETIAHRLPPEEAAGHHRRLASVLERADVEAEVLAAHWLGAGETRTAAGHYSRAAELASQALAFDRAAGFYQLAIDLGDSQGEGRRRLVRLMADSLANAGRGAEAARAYLAAAGAGTRAESVELKRLAAGHLIRSGHVDEGLQRVGEVLRALGTRLPRTAHGALWSLLWNRLKLRLRGVGFRLRAATEVPADELERIDGYWAIVTGLSGVDPIRGFDFQTRCLLLALRAGEPHRIARSLAIEAVSTATAGGPPSRWTAGLIRATEDVARKIGHPYAEGMAVLARGLVTYLQGGWKRARELLGQAEAIFQQCQGVSWEVASVRTFSFWAMAYLGEFAELSRRCPALLKEARERGDLYAETNLFFAHVLLRLGADDADGARRELGDLMERWSHTGFHVQHHNALVLRVFIESYDGNGLVAWENLCELWPAYRASLLLRVQQVRVNAHYLRGCGAVAASREVPEPEPLLRSAEADAKALRRERMKWADALAALLEAQIAAGRGDMPGAIRRLRDAAARLDAVDMAPYAASARRRLGVLVGGEEGARLVADADAWMESQQIRNPARMAGVYVPGFDRAG